MYSRHNRFLFAFVSLWGLTSAAISPLNFNPSFNPFSSSFAYPQPPSLQAEFTANFMQQKYDTELRNHITAGFAYFSPSARKVRLDVSLGPNDTLAVSIFDFNNVTSQTEIKNTIISFPEGVIRSQITCSSFIGNAGEPLFAPDLLNSTQAAFIGVQNDALHGPLNAWQFTFPPNVIVTAFVDNNNTLLRYDFSAPEDPLKTFVTTRFFNIVAGPVSPGVFETDCP